jgi:hypothetical protein
MKAYRVVDVKLHIILTLALVGDEWSASYPGWDPLDKRLGGSQSWYGQYGENSYPYQDSKCDPSVVHPITSSYTKCGILAP